MPLRPNNFFRSSDRNGRVGGAGEGGREKRSPRGRRADLKGVCFNSSPPTWPSRDAATLPGRGLFVYTLTFACVEGALFLWRASGQPE